MFFLRIEVRFLKPVLLFLLLVTIGAGIFNYGKFRDVSFNLQCTAEVEIFDAGRGEVIKKLTPDRAIRREAERLLENVNGTVVKFSPLPERGIIARIPMDPPVRINNRMIKDCGIYKLDTLYVVFPEGSRPYILVLDERQRPFFFWFEGETDILRTLRL